jgi:hypothetical protein
MAKSAKISPIPKEYNGSFHSIESSLARAGFYRAPGTARTFLPYKESTGKYRTGLDENADYLKRLPEEERNAEIKRIKADRARLEEATGLDLSPTSKYYNFASNETEDKKCSPVKLGNQDKFFDLTDPIQEITWNWIRVYPLIASSYEAYKRGDFDPNMTQFYVCDDEIETKRTHQRKLEINKAIVAFQEMDIEKRRKVARLMGLPVTDETKEEVVYNLMDDILKSGEFKTGEYKGSSTIRIFNDILGLSSDRLHLKDVIDEAIRRSVYRMRGDKIYEGENKIAESKRDLIDYLMDDENQEELLALEKKVKVRKMSETM